jgi:hypothetical protein
MLQETIQAVKQKTLVDYVKRTINNAGKPPKANEPKASIFIEQ